MIKEIDKLLQSLPTEGAELSLYLHKGCGCVCDSAGKVTNKHGGIEKGCGCSGSTKDVLRG